MNPKEDLALDFERTVKLIEGRGVMPERPPSLEVTRVGLKKIGFIDEPHKCVIVAGTNGKGSVCATLEALLTSAGERVGLYTSPHLIESTERIRVGARDISRQDFVASFRAVDAKTKDLKLTHFETMTLMAIWYFTAGEISKPVDRMILEVGLGGTWDSTNAVAHDACVITRLGFDHQNILGPTLRDIALNKFGVVSKGAVVVHAPLEPSLHELAKQVERETKSRWLATPSFDYEVVEKVEAGHQIKPIYNIKTPWGTAPINLAGPRGVENTTLALTLFRELGFDPAEHLTALKDVVWPGRMELLNVPQVKGRVYLSGDHNPQGVQSLLSLLAHYKFKKLRFLVGVGVDKDLEEILKPLFSYGEAEVFLTETPFRGVKIRNYGSWLSKSKGFSADQGQAFKLATCEMEDDDLTVVTGSLYLVGLIKKLVGQTSR